jgi:protein-S-isoprenylcysteine O-methyltransferase Ste14
MTTRERIERRGMLIRTYAVVFVLAAVVGAFLVFPELAGSTAELVKIAIGYIVVLIICLVLAARVLCPRCRTSLGEYVVTAAQPQSSQVIPNSCPNCGMGFDIEISPKQERTP